MDERRQRPRTGNAADNLHTSALWLLGLAAITLVPHAATHLPAWLAGLSALLLAWRAWLVHQHAPPPNRLVLLLMTGAIAIGVKLHYGHFFGKDPGLALLAALLCLKMLEARNARDIRATVLLSFFLQLGLFFENQTMAVATAAIAGTLIATVTLLTLHDAAASIRIHLRTAAVLLGQGLPFMLALFVLFPRVQGPLWGLPADAHSARTGLSDSMEPGSISELIQSDEIAFRAEFVGAAPPPAQRYWRGPVLTDFDGRTWRPAPAVLAPQPVYPRQGVRHEYRLTLEPSGRPWVPALEFAAGADADMRYASDYRVVLQSPVRQRRRFELFAYPDTGVGLTETQAVLTAALALPSDANPRARALARRLARDARSADAIVARTIEQLRASRLTYTLRPPRLGAHSVDEFLFDTRRGFCEHFSSAFVFLMRAAGVPARVVTGYQGGELNPVDGSLVVRQSDAHAWAEVWLAGRGWVRIDPTAVAAPMRIEEGLAAALPQGEPLPFLMRPALAWLREARHQWEAVSNLWNQWVLGYNPDRQRDLLGRLGMSGPDWKSLAFALAASFGALILALLAWAIRQRDSTDPLDRAWNTLCQRLARRGSTRHPWEGPLDYVRRIAKKLPDQAEDLRDIAATYARLRYGPPPSRAAVRTLAHRIRRLKL